MRDYSIFKDKKIFLKTKSNRQYQGQILETDDKTLILKDRYGKIVLINLDEIEVLEENF